MGGKNRNQRRQSAGSPTYLLFDAETALGWRVIRHVSGAQGEEMLARGAWRDVYDDLGNHIGYQMIAAAEILRSSSDPLPNSSASSITVGELKLNAGLGGKSRTAGMSENMRITRRDLKTGASLPPEDAIEKAQTKVREWQPSHVDRIVVC
jgi:hypothetical protein